MGIKWLLPLLGGLALTSAQAQQKGYYRTPALHGNTVVFTAEGDLWKYDLGGGTAARLTTHPGVELNPAVSPDGKQIAFLGQYEGATEVYVMPFNGGVPKRMSYDYNSYNLQLVGWTKEGKILYRTDKFSRLPSPQLALIDPATGNTEPLPLWQASQGCYDETGMLYFTRFPNQGSKTKRYKGGFIEQVWRFDGKSEAVNLTGDYAGTSSHPMYHNGRVFFLSDRDGTMNIWSMSREGKDPKQHTFSKAWDLQSPSLNGSRIVYQKGADIWLYDIAANREQLLDISLLSDFDQRKPRWMKSPVNTISHSDISPNGNYAAIISRGRVFVSPSKSDRWVEVVRKSGIRFKEVHFVDNKTLALLSDESGEYEVWTMKADGSDVPKQVTKGSKTMITFFDIAPNGRHIAYCDKNDVLRVADVATGAVKFSYDSVYAGNYGFSWSPDSRFLSFTVGIDNLNAQVHVLDLNTLRRTAITTRRLDSYSPSWSADSNWLFFVSDRNLRSKVSSPWGPRQPEPYYTETGNIYAIPLDTAARFPFLPTDSWLADSSFLLLDSAELAEKAALAKAKKKPAPAARSYNWAGALTNLYQVPVKSGNIANLAAADGYLYWLDIDPSNYGAGGRLYALKIAESKKYEPVEVASGVGGFVLSGNKKKLLVTFMNRTLAIADANGAKINAEEAKLVLNNWSFQINPPEDWRQMYEDAWRMMRDYFYDRDLHKVKWDSVRRQYEPLLARVTDRYELDDLIAQAVGELSALHTFVYGGDKRTSPDQVPIGFLGALLDKHAQGARIRHIYRNDPDYPETASPLFRPEGKIREGHIITAVNNIPVNSVNNIAELLANKVGVPVKLTLLSTAGRRYEQVVKPFSAYDEYNIRYGEWELSRRELVDSLSGNDIGYVHLRAMGGNDMNDFVKQFYPVFNRKGLVIDVRHNFGGNIDSWVLEKLMRKAWMYWQGRSGGPTWNMQYAFRGHMVILCDQVTSSDGEAVTEGFRRLGLGKVIGMRTWGGEIWLSSSNRLVDNGIASAAEFGVFGPEGQWLIEGHGVDPDIVVDNLPFETYKGKDAQLEYAVDYLKKLIKEKPVPDPKAPAYPDKSFKY
ncbi:MAG TPA: S41 family peptidase [Chitinophagaceae bacterium]|jgi:tricorn protease|nr:S41 family peptidase [Chitinophagaceae bacterium]